MTEVLTVSGNLEGVKVRLERIRDIVNRRKAEGYPLWSQYERWQYVTMRDINVCPVCEQHDRNIYTGERIKQLFPYAEYVGGYVAFPQTHKTHEALSRGIRGECRCQLYMINPAEAFEQQLHREKLEAM